MTNYTTLESAKKVKKETVFTKIINSNISIEKATTIKPTDFLNILHIGADRCYGDVFMAWDDDKENFTLLFGEKGDEFD